MRKKILPAPSENESNLSPKFREPEILTPLKKNSSPFHHFVRPYPAHAPACARPAHPRPAPSPRRFSLRRQSRLPRASPPASPTRSRPHASPLRRRQLMGRVAAGLGRAQALTWIAAMMLFYVPMAVSVIYLNRQMPLEGGLYVWARAGLRRPRRLHDRMEPLGLRHRRHRHHPLRHPHRALLPHRPLRGMASGKPPRLLRHRRHHRSRHHRSPLSAASNSANGSTTSAASPSSSSTAALIVLPLLGHGAPPVPSTTTAPHRNSRSSI